MRKMIHCLSILLLTVLSVSVFAQSARDNCGYTAVHAAVVANMCGVAELKTDVVPELVTAQNQDDQKYQTEKIAPLLDPGDMGLSGLTAPVTKRSEKDAVISRLKHYKVPSG